MRPEPIILVAEDNVTLRFLAAKQLASLGYDCHLAEDGFEAVASASSKRYDVIFMDVHMPRMDGLEATVAIRENERQRNRAMTPIIAMTANPDKLKCFEAGMNDFVFKPVTVKSLQAVLTQWLPRPQV